MTLLLAEVGEYHAGRAELMPTLSAGLPILQTVVDSFTGDLHTL